MIRISSLLLVALAACAGPPPDVDTGFATGDASGGYPRLIPLEGALPDPGSGRVTDADTEETAARADRLRRRAEALHDPVIDEAEKDRLQGAATPTAE